MGSKKPLERVFRSMATGKFETRCGASMQRDARACVRRETLAESGRIGVGERGGWCLGPDRSLSLSKSHLAHPGCVLGSTERSWWQSTQAAAVFFRANGSDRGRRSGNARHTKQKTKTTKKNTKSCSTPPLWAVDFFGHPRSSRLGPPGIQPGTRLITDR